MKVNVLNRRATLFVVPPLEAITEKNLPNYVNAFAGLSLLPSINKGLALKLTPQGVIQESIVSVEMKLLDDSFKVTTGPDRFDIISIQKDQTLQEFLDLLAKVIDAVGKIYTGPIIRLALCSGFAFTVSPTSLEEAYGKIIKNVNEEPVEWQVRKVLRDELKEGDKKLIINNVYTISRNIIQMGQDVPSDCIILDMDINTLVGSDPNLIKTLENTFWESASQVIEKSLEHYSNLLGND